ncbi:MAG: AMP-binding protein [Verrucomicrobia bacterium]|nr:AMP-binding protein [Verrucomicrobiota bacterium]
MSTLFWTFIGFLARGLFSLRYKVRTKGCFEVLDEKLENGILILPNHSAHMDPPLLFFYFWPKFRMRPVVIEYIYRIGALKFLMQLTRAIAVPNFDTSVNQYKIYKAQLALKEVSEGLKRKENFILYPAGRLKLTAEEILGGASGAHAIVQECPYAHVMLVRTTGFWGSSFSRAFEGKSLSLGRSFKHAVKAIFKNFIFFLPRREILIECELDPKGLPRQGTRVEFNKFLEQWYNQYPDGKGNRVQAEPLKLISYSFWKRDIPEIKTTQKKEKENNHIAISPETVEKVYRELARILDRPSLEPEPEMGLAADLGLDSLNIAELIAYLSQNFDVEDLHPEDIVTVRDVLEAASLGKETAHDRAVKQGSTNHWPEETGRPDPVLPIGRTVPEAFLRSCERMDGFAACGDDTSGVLSYKKLKQAVLVLAAHFESLPGERIGILLPSSIGAYICILATQMAGKTPVMINWTLGPRYVDEMVSMTGVQVVLTSWKFLEKAQHVDFGKAIEKFVLLEDIRKELSFKTKLKGALLARAPLSMAMKMYGVDKICEDDPCVILFTSGTEATPKGVPLSHKNILSNLRSAMLCIEIDNRDVLYGILPPFHSFGYSVAGIFPILAGLKFALYPDPTDSFALAEGVNRWKITMFCAAPSFLKGLFHAAKKEQLSTVRMFVSGAEKAPAELFERVAQLGNGAKLVEGYGLTECSPIVSLVRPNMEPKGVGMPLPDVEICTIHLETGQLLPHGAEGEILVRGPNVFKGYLGNPRTAFIEIEGKQWYKTGDIGYIDPEGNLILSGRLKRFAKIGGEMISLGAVESTIISELLKQGKISTDVPALALLGKEKEPGKTDLILFSTVSLGKEEINEILNRAGFSRLIKISAVQKINEIPLMGTGKTDYRRLQTLMA